MEALSAFFAENAERKEDVSFVVSTRFKGKDGKPIPWVLQSISAEDDESLRKDCTRRVQVPGKKGQYTNSFDSNAYLVKLAVKSVKFPDLNNAELQNSYRAMGAEQLIVTMLYKDEFDALAEKLTNMSTDEDINDLVAEAKN